MDNLENVKKCREGSVRFQTPAPGFPDVNGLVTSPPVLLLYCA